MKLKHIIIGLVSMLGIGAAVGTTNINNNVDFEETKADETVSYALPTSDGNLIFRKYDENNSWNWNYGGAKTAVFFANSNNNPSKYCWSKIVSEDEKCGSGNEKDVGTYTDYFVYPTDTSTEWTYVKYVRLSNTATEPSWDEGILWYQTDYIALSTNFNGYGPRYNNSKDGVYWVNPSYDVYEKGSSLYLDLSTWDGLLSDWTAANAVIQAYFWGSNRGEEAQSVQMYPVKGFYNNEGAEDESENVALYEVAVPATSGGYAAVLFGRYDSISKTTWWNQTLDFYAYSRIDRDEPYTGSDTDNHITENNVFNIFWKKNDDPKYYGLWHWNLTAYNRANKFARYVLDQTNTRCTSDYYDINTSSDFIDAWTNMQGNGAWKTMGQDSKNEFKNVTADQSSAYNNPKGAARYDYILGKYGNKTPTLTNFAGRTTVSINPRPILNIAIVNNSAAPIIISVIAVISLTAIGGYYFLSKNKKKENQ